MAEPLEVEFISLSNAVSMLCGALRVMEAMG